VQKSRFCFAAARAGRTHLHASDGEDTEVAKRSCADDVLSAERNALDLHATPSSETRRPSTLPALHRGVTHLFAVLELAAPRLAVPAVEETEVELAHGVPSLRRREHGSCLADGTLQSESTRLHVIKSSSVWFQQRHVRAELNRIHHSAAPRIDELHRAAVAGLVLEVYLDGGMVRALDTWSDPYVCVCRM